MIIIDGCILPCVRLRRKRYKVRTEYNVNPDWLAAETTPAFINVSPGRRCHVNKPLARLTVGQFVVRRSYLISSLCEPTFRGEFVGKTEGRHVIHTGLVCNHTATLSIAGKSAKMLVFKQRSFCIELDFLLKLEYNIRSHRLCFAAEIDITVFVYKRVKLRIN